MNKDMHRKNEHTPGNENTRTRFNRWSRSYDSRRGLFFFRHLHRRLAPRLEIRAGDRVLDVGCGTGELLLFLARRNPSAQFVGVDLSERMLEIARSKAERAAAADLAGPPDISFELAPAEHLPFADGSFDLVVSTMSLHHWDDPAAGIAECLRTLKPGGMLAVIDIMGETRVSRIYRVCGPLRNWFHRHTRYLRPAQIADMLAQAGAGCVVQEGLLPAIVLTTARQSRPSRSAPEARFLS